jgi:exosortase A-associated hydrolase 2
MNGITTENNKLHGAKDKDGALEIFYFGEDTHRMFGVLHRPQNQVRAGVVFCPPYGEEMVSTYAHFSRWAKELTQQGFAVLRFHPYGTGESDGAPLDFTLESAMSDASLAFNCLKERVKLKHVGLFGLRFGGLVAVQAASVCRPDFLILWSPIVQPKQYCRELLRLLLTKEIVHQQVEQVRVTTQSLVAELNAGRSVDIMGYEMSPAFYRQMTVGSSWPTVPPAPDVLWLVRPRDHASADSLAENWRTHGANVSLQAFEGAAFWEDWEFGFPQKFAKSSAHWLMQRVANI